MRKRDLLRIQRKREKIEMGRRQLHKLLYLLLEKGKTPKWIAQKMNKSKHWVWRRLRALCGNKAYSYYFTQGHKKS